MKRILLLAALLGVACSAEAQDTCSEAELEDGAKYWFMNETHATYCTNDATNPRWECYGDGGRTWEVKRTLRNPGVRTRRSVEPSQGDVWGFDCEWDESAGPCVLIVCGAD